MNETIFCWIKKDVLWCLYSSNGHPYVMLLMQIWGFVNSFDTSKCSIMSFHCFCSLSDHGFGGDSINYSCWQHTYNTLCAFQGGFWTSCYRYCDLPLIIPSCYRYLFWSLWWMRMKIGKIIVWENMFSGIFIFL